MGTSFLGISTPPPTAKCEVQGCENPGKGNHCDGDGRFHSHGMTHVNGHRLAWVCAEHGKTVDAWWALHKAGLHPKPVMLKD